LRKSTLKMLEDHRDRHRNKGNGFGMHVLANDAISNAIVVGGMGRERNLLVDSRSGGRITAAERRLLDLNVKNIRRMTPREFARLQGFPESFRIPVSDSQAYKQFGNSVTVHLVAAVVKEVLRAL
jgi:DNA (cytosine-5)-methyltransferase 1